MQVNCSSLTSLGDECWHRLLLPFLLVLELVDTLSHFMAEICYLKWTRQLSDFSCFFLVQKVLAIECHSSIFPPSLKTHKSSCHVIHVTKWECSMGCISTNFCNSLKSTSFKPLSLLTGIQILNLYAYCWLFYLGFALHALFLGMSPLKQSCGIWQCFCFSF